MQSSVKNRCFVTKVKKYIYSGWILHLSYLYLDTSHFENWFEKIVLFFLKHGKIKSFPGPIIEWDSRDTLWHFYVYALGIKAKTTVHQELQLPWISALTTPIEIDINRYSSLNNVTVSNVPFFRQEMFSANG